MDDFLVLSRSMIAKYGATFAIVYSTMDNLYVEGLKSGSIKENEFFHIRQELIASLCFVSHATLQTEIGRLISEGFIDKENVKNKTFYRVNLGVMNDFVTNYDIQKEEESRAEEAINKRSKTVKAYKQKKRQKTSI